jgi:Polyketide cyclase / dehydrase and lipid transport
MSSPVRVSQSVQIDKLPADVWTAIADYSFDYKWRQGLKDMTPDPPGPPAPGTKVHEVVRSPGRDFVADIEVTEVNPGVSYRFRGAGTIGGLAGGRSVHANGAGSVFTYEVEVEPRGAMRLLRPVLGSMVGSRLKQDLTTLKALLESDG